MFWHHVTVLMQPGPVTRWRWGRIWLGYGLVVIAIVLQANAQHFFISVSGTDPLYLKTLEVGPLYLLFAFFMLLYIGLSVANLLRSARTAPIGLLRKQFITLAVATLIGGFIGPLSLAASMFKLPVPVLALAVVLGLAVILIGYGVARYSALVDGHVAFHRHGRLGLQWRRRWLGGFAVSGRYLDFCADIQPPHRRLCLDCHPSYHHPCLD
jgi:hypothetical protein